MTTRIDLRRLVDAINTELSRLHKANRLAVDFENDHIYIRIGSAEQVARNTHETNIEVLKQPKMAEIVLRSFLIGLTEEDVLLRIDDDHICTLHHFLTANDEAIGDFITVKDIAKVKALAVGESVNLFISVANTTKVERIQ